MSKQIINAATLSRLGERALSGIQREYPNTLERFLQEPKPRAIHPAFYGCYDWHSAVHTHWLLIKLLKSFPDLPDTTAIRNAISHNLTAENLLAEVANFGQPNQPIPDTRITALTQPGQPGFERPYGWAWLLQLAAELHNWADQDGPKWEQQLQPLTQKIVECFNQFLSEHQPPNRKGQHENTAFALALALDYARVCSQPGLENKLISYSLDYYLSDAPYAIESEPGSFDFLSPALVEADLMRRVLSPQEFTDWFNRFLPDIAQGQPALLLQPVVVPDHNDPFISHLDGLNLSRAWCMYNISAALPEEARNRQVLAEAAARHAQAGLATLFAGDFNSSGHWLGTFAVYLLA